MARRSGSIAWALAGIAVLAVILSLEAVRSERYRVSTTERVLSDYAALGAEAVTTRLQNFLSPRLFVILGAVNAGPPPPAHRDSLVKGVMANAAPLAASVQWAARIGAAGAGSFVRYDSTASVPTGLVGLIGGRKLPDYAYFGLVPVDSQLVVFGAPRPGRDTTPVYAVPLSALRSLIGTFLESDPILPPSLTHDRPLGGGAAVSVVLPGRPVAERGTAGQRFRAEHSLGPMFGDMKVTVELADSLGAQLVVGGLPGSRVPFLVLILLLAIGLAAAGMLQLRQRERLTQLRDDFVAGASHELRTPLAQIRLFAETLRLERVRSEEERSRSLAVIEREARRLTHLVENLLHFSRAERGTLTLAPEVTALGTLTREVVADFAPLADRAGVTLRAEAIGAVTLRVDPSAWRQLLLNLLDNAVKYGAGSAVTVTLSGDSGGARLTVSDQGPGVPPGDRGRIWERFSRGANAQRAGITGTGIGLATVRDLVALHGGVCRVETAEPRGARFVVELPAG